MIKRGAAGRDGVREPVLHRPSGRTAPSTSMQAPTRIASKLMRQDVPNSNPNGNTPFEKDLYFYHRITSGAATTSPILQGKLYEHLEYFPFGEGWIEENTNVQRTPYLFTAKELDEETGTLLLRARYYDPRTSIWQSGDPILGKYLTGEPNGGVFVSRRLVYSYGHLNPVGYSDPDGLSAWNRVMGGFAGSWRHC